MIEDLKNRLGDSNRYYEEQHQKVWELERQIKIHRTSDEYQKGNYEVTFEFKVNIPAISASEAERGALNKLFNRFQELCIENQYHRYGWSGCTDDVGILVGTELFGLPKNIRRKT